MLNVSTKLDFKIIQEIGTEGKNSQVFLAKDTQLNAIFAIKRMKKETFKNKNEYFEEAQKLYYSAHSNIVKIQYASEDDEYIYFSMPYYNNGSLNSLINTRYLNVAEILKYSLDFLTGLHYIHTKKLVHLDIKPTNILINNANRALVTDFGLSKYLDINGFTENDYFYQLHRPPETLVTNKLDIRADIYQAGITMYRLCNGNNFLLQQLPRKATIHNIYDIIDNPCYLPHIPKKLRKIINRAMNINVNNRYSTVIDLMNDLCTLDENLFWMYNKDNKINNNEHWTLENDKHIFNIVLELKNSKWAILVLDKSKKSGRQIIKRKLCSENYKTKELALKQVSKLFKQIK